MIWGSGKPKRELMFVDDFADAVVFFMKKKIKEPYLNIGTGKDYSIKWYANFLMKKLNVTDTVTKHPRHKFVGFGALNGQG